MVKLLSNKIYLIATSSNLRYVNRQHCDLYHKPIVIVNDDYSIIVNKLETSIIDDIRVVIYNCHTFIAQATYYKRLAIEIKRSLN